MKVLSARLDGPGKLRLAERELEIGDADILVKTHQASICLADVQMYRKGFYAEGTPIAFPLYPGHEGGGTVEAVGPRVDEFKPGDRVILMHDVRAGGLGPGAMATHFKARSTDLVPVPDEMDMDLACLAETISPFIFMVHKCGVKLGDTVVVTGANFIGQIVAQGVKKSGAYKVIVVDANDFRLNLARKLGADLVINSQKEDAFAQVMASTNAKGADVVCQTAAYVDTTVEEYMNLATRLVRPMGILAFQGDFLHPIRIHLHRWHHEAIDIRSIAFRHYSWREVQAWTESTLKPIMYGLVEIKPLITATYRLDDIAKAYEEATNNPDALKVVLKP